ncbi:hypothetical protein VKT23_011530 [Stygiomarasmius scandens]|uniref:Uncharacterized protein n=1 Tax=Marasmiellus scandens TaxID=2682957 RepID=A0ABR1JB47_9AGAR
MGNSQSSGLPSFNTSTYANLAYGFASILEPLGPHARMLHAILLGLENAQENKSGFESVGQRAGRLASIINGNLHLNNDMAQNTQSPLDQELEKLYREIEPFGDDFSGEPAIQIE